MLPTSTVAFATKKSNSAADRHQNVETSSKTERSKKRSCDKTPNVIFVDRDFSDKVCEILDRSSTKKILIVTETTARSNGESETTERFVLTPESVEKRVAISTTRIKKLVTDAYVMSQGNIARVKTLVEDDRKQEALSALSVLARKLGSALAKTGLVEIVEPECGTTKTCLSYSI